MEAVESVQTELACSGDVSDDGEKLLIKTEDEEIDEASNRGNRENRLTTIIDQLRYQTKAKGMFDFDNKLNIKQLLFIHFEYAKNIYMRVFRVAVIVLKSVLILA